MALLGSLGTPGADFLRAPDKVGDHLFFMVCAPHPPTLFLLLQRNVGAIVKLMAPGAVAGGVGSG